MRRPRHVFTCKQSVIQCFPPVSFKKIIPSGLIFDICQRFQLSDQIDISHQQIVIRIFVIHPIVISTDDIFEVEIFPAEMVLSTQKQKTFPLKFYLGSIIATQEEKLFLNA